MNDAELRSEIVAALVWDWPTLRSGSKGARDFAEAFSARPLGASEAKHPPDGALGLAAEGVKLLFEGEVDYGVKVLAQLASSEAEWTRLLGLMLQAWSQLEDSEQGIDDASRMVRGELEMTGELKARLLAKLVTYSFDAGLSEQGRELLREAIASAPLGTSLNRALAFEGMNAGIRVETSDPNLSVPPDPLVQYPWIVGDSLDAAQRALTKVAEESARKLWTSTIQIGGNSPVDAAGLAEIQATWAGALWLRRPIRKQVGAQLLTGEADSPAQWAHGVLMWTLGGGKDPGQAYALAEPGLDQEATDSLLSWVARAEIHPRYSNRFASIANAAWDAVSDEVLEWAVERLGDPTEVGKHEVDVQGIWAGYAARLPEGWYRHFASQGEPGKEALIAMLGPGAIERFSATVREEIASTAIRALDSEAEGDLTISLVLAAAAPEGPPRALVETLNETANTRTVGALVEAGYGDLLDKAVIVSSRDELIATVRRQTQQAQEGTMSFGASDTRLSLARIVAGVDEPDPEATAVLIDVATDPGQPGEFLLHARQGLTLIRHAHGLDAGDLETLHNAEDPTGRFAAHGSITVELVRNARLRALAEDLTHAETLAVVGACRGRDGRARQIALATCAEALRGGGKAGPEAEALAWALVGGLFDPSDAVVAAAIRGIRREFLGDFELPGRVVLDRLPRLARDASVTVRAAAAALARSASKQGPFHEDPHTAAVRALAAGDKSWRVRNAEPAPAE